MRVCGLLYDRSFYHDYVGKVLPLLDDGDYLDDGKSAPTPLAAGAKKRP